MSRKQGKLRRQEKEDLISFIKNTFGPTLEGREQDGWIISTVYGRHIFCLETLADELVCKKCYAILSLLDATNVAFASGVTHDQLVALYDVKCRNCQTVSKVNCDMNDDMAEVRRNSYRLKEPYFGKRSGIKGRRVLDVNLLANELVCKKCNTILSLLDVVKEDRYGFASIFQIPCRVCKEVSNVYTDKEHTVGDGKEKHFNVNTSVVGLFLLEGGNKVSLDIFFSHMKVPIMDSEMYRVHQEEIIDLREKMAPKNPAPVVEKKSWKKSKSK